MRWKPPSERAQFILALPVIIPICAVAVPALLVMVPTMWLWYKAERAMRSGKEYGPWFAWRPVRINDWFDPAVGRWVWLEWIERRWNRYHEYRTKDTAHD